MLTARCEAWLVGDANPLRTSLERLAAFAHAGADYLYAPGLSKLDEIAAIVKTVAPKPINVLVSTNNCNLTVAELRDLGVRRIYCRRGFSANGLDGLYSERERDQGKGFVRRIRWGRALR